MTKYKYTIHLTILAKQNTSKIFGTDLMIRQFKKKLVEAEITEL